MKAVRFHSHGDVWVLRHEEAPTPRPGREEARVAVSACALNPLDIWVRTGSPAYPVTLPHIGGCDISGVVVEIPPNTYGIEVGHRVVIAPGLSCFQCVPCRSGQDNRCTTYRILGAGSPGGFAEYVVAPIANLMRIPEFLSFELAAAFPITFLTAWHMLIGRAQLKPHQTLLVMGASGGIGTAALQIGKWIGAKVIAAVGHSNKIERAQQAGAHAVVDYSQPDVAADIQRLTEGRGADVAIDSAGSISFALGLNALAPGGTLVICGATAGPHVTLELRPFFSKEWTVMGARMGTRSELIEVTRLISDGALIPILDSVFPLAQLQQAQEKMLSRDFFGKIVVIP